MTAALPGMLPCDPDALRAMILAERAGTQLLIEERDRLAAERDELTARTKNFIT